MNTTQAQQKALDDALVAPADRLEFGKCNMRLKTDIKPKEATFQVVLDALALTPFYQAFLITTEVPAIYMQEFWATVSVHKQKFKDLPLEHDILSFIRDLGHSGDIIYLSDVEKHNGKKYVLVIVDDYSRYTWTHFLSLSPDPQSQENVPQVAETVTTSNELELLYSPMFSELLNGTSPVVSNSFVVHAADNPGKRQQHNTTHTSTTTGVADPPPLNIHSTHQTPTQVPTVTAPENIIQAKTNTENA
ncbi:retrovirus-related pol polyprotein from transposon TNT 1-94 [Tanacetum coccineum]